MRQENGRKLGENQGICRVYVDFYQFPRIVLKMHDKREVRQKFYKVEEIPELIVYWQIFSWHLPKTAGVES